MFMAGRALISLVEKKCNTGPDCGALHQFIHLPQFYWDTMSIIELYSFKENPRGGEVWWAAVSGVTQSRTRLKWLSSSSKYSFIRKSILISCPLPLTPSPYMYMRIAFAFLFSPGCTSPWALWQKYSWFYFCNPKDRPLDGNHSSAYCILPLNLIKNLQAQRICILQRKILNGPTWSWKDMSYVSQLLH